MSRSFVNSPFIVPLSGTQEETDRADVGGKAASLIRMCKAGLPVPPGAVITSGFFTPWFDELAASGIWTRLIKAPLDDWPSLCRELKRHALTLSLTEMQRNAVQRLLQDPSTTGGTLRFAVRSSSPEEDMDSVSFAGIYETRLGVCRSRLEDAVRAGFASSLDLRVFIYKKARGLDVWKPRIAVIVQQQIDSMVAGVAFSLNPATNDYDEVVIEANWGLGSSVVEGRISPDHFVVNSFERTVVEEARGNKRSSTWLAAGDGTLERENHRSAECTLTDAQLHELADMTRRVEELYERPIDLEWAYADNGCHLLQARPITNYVPLPAEMLTEPGERRRLYGDAALSKGLTINAPISPLGLDCMAGTFSAILESWVGPLQRGTPKEAMFFFAGGRMYMNYSSMMWLVSPATMAKFAAPTDTLMAEILASVDATRYRAAKKPSWVSLRLVWIIPRMLWRLRGFFWNLLRAFSFPERTKRRYLRAIDAFASRLHASVDDELSLDSFRHMYEARMAREMFDVLMPVLIAGSMRPGRVVCGKGAKAKALGDKLTRGVTGNVVVEMGIALYRLAALLERSGTDDLDRLAERIEQRRMPAPFLTAWDDFVASFGWRGPMEMDLASPRYADDPRLALRQISFMAIDDPAYDPEAAHQRQARARRQAYEQLMRGVGPLRRVLLRRVYRLIDLFAGTRDAPKDLIVLFNYAVRKRALAEGRRLQQAGRLDAAEDVFDLTFDDLGAASRDVTLDLRQIREERTRFQRKLKAHVAMFPAVIDSRGRILRPRPRRDEPDLLSGMPVSPGRVTGPVKVLHSPYEKRVEKGDVLVAYTTDPGWTPLFVNAAAIVLEVGGVLQHGAVVAREYGKPCVVGIDRVAERLHDGEAVEVDGTMGTVGLLSRRSDADNVASDFHYDDPLAHHRRRHDLYP